MNAGEMFKSFIDQVSLLTIPVIFVLIIGYGIFKRIKLYESFIDGGKEGFSIFLKILPYIVAIIVAIGVFRACGALDFLAELLSPISMTIGMPGELVPVALMKPLSGSGSLGLVADIIAKQPNTLNSEMASTMFGSTDTTLYIIALYFGSVGIKKIRHAMIVGLTADAVGIIVAVWISRLVFGNM